MILRGRIETVPKLDLAHFSNGSRRCGNHKEKKIALSERTTGCKYHPLFGISSQKLSINIWLVNLLQKVNQSSKFPLISGREYLSIFHHQPPTVICKLLKGLD